MTARAFLPPPTPAALRACRRLGAAGVAAGRNTGAGVVGFAALGCITAGALGVRGGAAFGVGVGFLASTFFVGAAFFGSGFLAIYLILVGGEGGFGAGFGRGAVPPLAVL